MNAFTIFEAIGAIDDRALSSALSFNPGAQKNTKKQPRRTMHRLVWIVAAACLCLVALGAVGLMLESLHAPSDFVVENGVLLSYTGSDTEIVIPENVTSIADGAFCQNQTLQSIRAPGVTQIGSSAFENCPALQSASFPDATHIGDFAFRGCSNLEQLGISNATCVGQGFIDGTSIQVLIIPEVMQVLDEYTFTDPKPELWGYRNTPLHTFAELYGFTFVNINEATQVWGDFIYLEFVDHIRICGYTGTSTDVLIPEQINAKPVTEMCCELFESILLPLQHVSSKEVTSLSAPSVQRLIVDPYYEDKLHLYTYHSLKVLDMPMLRNLPDQAFYECVSLQEIRLDNLQSIGSNVFCCGQFTELYLPRATYIAADAFLNTEIRTLHGKKDSYVQTWAAHNGYGFVDLQNDYVPEYLPRETDPSTLIYHPVSQHTPDITSPYGYCGIDLAHDRSGMLYMHVADWDAYLKTPLKQYISYSKDQIASKLHAAAVCGDTAWLIAASYPLYSHSKGVSCFSMASITRQGEIQSWSVELGQTYCITRMSLYFSDAKNGKLLITYEESVYQRLLLLKTEDGGKTWNEEISESLPVSYGGAKTARPFTALGFVSDQIGFASIDYWAEIEPETRTYLTYDGGKTWANWNYATTKEEMPDGYGETISLTLKDGILTLTVRVHGGNLKEPYYLIYKSSDYGASWQPCQ